MMWASIKQNPLNSMPPIYITDLDHTLLRSDQSISDFTAKVWNSKTEDAILSIATARSFQKSLHFLDKLHLDAPMILLDGTMIVTPKKKLVEIKTLNKAQADAIIAEGAKYDIYPFIIALKDIVTLEESFLFPTTLNAYQHGVLENYRNDPRMVACKNIHAIEMNLKLVYFGSHETLTPLAIHLEQTFGKELEYKLSPENYSDGWFLTILHPEGDKAHALTKVMEYLEQECKDVTVFGDSVNDIEMFKVAGTSVAVSNALDEVKAVADVVLPYSNDEDGVARYLKEI